MKNLFVIAVATTLMTPVVCLGAADSNRESMQQELDAACEAARERRLCA